MLVFKLDIGDCYCCRYSDLNNTNNNILCIAILFLFLFVDSPIIHLLSANNDHKRHTKNI